jgi:hypothetical protein
MVRVMSAPRNIRDDYDNEHEHDKDNDDFAIRRFSHIGFARQFILLRAHEFMLGYV